MANNNIFHTKVIIEELMRIADAELKPQLNLASVIRGDLSQTPTPGILNIVPGIWIQANPTMQNAFGSLPKEMEQTYFFRMVYVRKLAVGENFVQKNEDDAALIGNTYTDHIYLPDITNLPTGTFILWAYAKNIEYQPPEDRFVQQIHADLAAIAINFAVYCKTRRAT